MFFWFLTQPETFTLLAIILAFVAAFAATPLFTIDNRTARLVAARSVQVLVVLTVTVGVFAGGLWLRWWWI